MNKLSRLFLFAGEPSGDLHGSHLIARLKERHPTLQCTGVGGPLMRNQGMECLHPMEDFTVMGFTDVMRSLPKLIRRFYTICQAIVSHSPQVVILIDYPGFNLRLARALRKKGYAGRIVQYVSPSVWAHGKERIKVMSQSLDLLLAIYPFEIPLYADSALKAEYVGNPLWEYIQFHPYEEHWKKILKIPEKAPLLALFPGSRSGEIKRNFDLMFKAALALKHQNADLVILISEVHPETYLAVAKALSETNLRLGRDLFLIPPSFTYEMMRSSHCAIAKSGTVTLELALHCCPTVVIYRVTWLNQLIAKYYLRLKLPDDCIVNILFGSSVFPELIEKDFSSEDIFQHLNRLFPEGEERQACQTGCQKIVQLLKTHRASERAAKLIEEVLWT